jgi:peptidoglycan lytic transglycosylase
MRKIFHSIFGLIVLTLLFGCATSRPDLAWKGKTQQGLASWYSYPFHGKRTSNGEIYNMNALTAAHPSMALNSIVEVRNEKNGRTVMVRINDRLPPNRKGRIIDLSKCAARELDMFIDGVVPVTMRVITYGNDIYIRTNRAAPNGKMYLKGQEPNPITQRQSDSESERS